MHGFDESAVCLTSDSTIDCLRDLSNTVAIRVEVSPKKRMHDLLKRHFQTWTAVCVRDIGVQHTSTGDIQAFVDPE